MNVILALIVVVVLGYYISIALVPFPFGFEKLPHVAFLYIKDGLKDNNASNLVTSIVVNYRGFDTLGEVTVLFIAASGVAFLLSKCRCMKEVHRYEASDIIKTSTSYLFPSFIVFGAYIFIHGHLTPGGGFQGGAVIASAVMYMFLAYLTYHPSHNSLSVIESLAGLTFVGLGLWGLWATGSFLDNLLPKGQWNRIVSAGVIPLIYVAIGFKVGSELSALLSDMITAAREKKG